MDRSRPGGAATPAARLVRRTPVSVHGVPPARRPLSEPHPRRLPDDTAQRRQILAAHDAALAAGDAGYLDPVTGLFVFTAATLLARGRCCASGCRHCPYL